MTMPATDVDIAAAAPPRVHDDGIYFGMPKDEYHADPAIGSGDTERLAFSPCDYWYQSWMNPQRPPDKSTPAQELGTALHVLVLESEAAFGARYMRGPDQDEGSTPAAKAARTKAANEKAAARGLIMIPAVDYDRIAIAGAMIMRNPKLATAFSGGASEVSVFWTERRDGTSIPIRKKNRWDYFKPRGIGDLKKVANQHEVPFPRACINAITNYNYHIQAKHYLDGRAMLPALVGRGAVFGDHDPALIRAALEAKRWGWQWIFWQGERAPLTHSLILSPGNPMLQVAGAVVARAEANYVEYMVKFGPAEMWLDFAEPSELMIENMPPWFARD